MNQSQKRYIITKLEEINQSLFDRLKDETELERKSIAVLIENISKPKFNYNPINTYRRFESKDNYLVYSLNGELLFRTISRNELYNYTGLNRISLSNYIDVKNSNKEYKSFYAKKLDLRIVITTRKIKEEEFIVERYLEYHSNRVCPKPEKKVVIQSKIDRNEIELILYDSNKKEVHRTLKPSVLGNFLGGYNTTAIKYYTNRMNKTLPKTNTSIIHLKTGEEFYIVTNPNNLK